MKINKNIFKLQEGGDIPSYSLPGVDIYPNNRWGDIARTQGLDTARKWSKIRGAVPQGTEKFLNHPITQIVTLLLPLPEISRAAGTAGKIIDRVVDKPRRAQAVVEHFSPFGYQLFNTYDGKIPEAYRFFKNYIIKGNDVPQRSWIKTRSLIEPKRTSNRAEAFRKYLQAPKSTDNLYIANSDGTFRYNPDKIPTENIEAQRELFNKAGNGNPSTEILTTDLNGPKGTRPGNAGRLISKIDSNGNFIIDDVFDLNPLQQFKWLPKSIQNIEFGKFIGGKPFHVLDKEIGKVSPKTSEEKILEEIKQSTSYNPSDYYQVPKTNSNSKFNVRDNTIATYLEDPLSGKTKASFDYIIKNGDIDERFLSPEYVTELRNYYANLGLSLNNYTDTDLAKILTNQYKQLKATTVGEFKDKILWHGSPKYFDKFDFKNHSGEFTGNNGVLGNGNYFLNRPTKYGRTYTYSKYSNLREPTANTSSQPYLINNIKEVAGNSQGELSSTFDFDEATKTARGNNLWLNKNPQNRAFQGVSTINMGKADEAGKLMKVVIPKDNDIKSLFPHPSTANGSGFIRNWEDPRFNYVIGGLAVESSLDNKSK